MVLVCQNQKGFTLLETMMVVGLTLILATISISALSTFGNRSNHREAAHIILGVFEDAHARTLASQDDSVYGVHLETSQAVLFKGDTYTVGDPSNETYPLPSKASITNINLGGSDDVVFERLSGSATPTGTVTVALMSDATQSKILTIHESGLTEITN